MSTNAEKDLLEKAGVYDVSQWVEHGRWVQPPLPSMLYAHWFTAKTLKNIFPEQTFNPFFSIDGYFIAYKKDFENVFLLLKSRYEKKSVAQFVDLLDGEGYRVFGEIQGNLQKDDAFIEKNIDTVMDSFGDLNSYLFTTNCIGEGLTRLAVESRYVTSEAELFTRVSPYLRETWIEAERRFILGLARQCDPGITDVSTDSIRNLIKNSPSLSEKVAQYIQEFVWSRISKWIGDPVDDAYVFSRIQEELKNIRKGTLTEIRRSQTDEKSLHVFLQLGVVTSYWRAQAAQMEAQISLRMRPFLERIARNNTENYVEGKGYLQALLLSPNELVRTIQDPDNKMPNAEKVLKRAQGFFGIFTNQGEEIILDADDEQYRRIKDLHINSAVLPDKEIDTLTGQGASPGYAKGRVRVIDFPEQYSSFQEGEILVASDTSPSHVPLMRLASAIVTGKGGITSHAAIVSRELGKPCVIAVKNVEKILKTGDMVEVDAKKGIVKRL